MIVLSGALVLVALVLLVLGLATQDLSAVYGSIAVSLVSFALLVVGVLQRRHEAPAGPHDVVDAGTGGGPSGKAVAPAPEAPGPPARPDEDRDADDGERPAEGDEPQDGAGRTGRRVPPPGAAPRP